MQHELSNRWEDFLAKMQQRFISTLNEGESAVLKSLNDNDYDYYSSFRTLHAIQSQVSEDIIRKVTDTWQNEVEPQMRNDGDYWVDEMKKGYKATEEMNCGLQMWAFVLKGKLSQKYYDHAIKLINKDFFCTQCHAPLEIKKDFFMSQYVTCKFCGAANTFEPETKYVTIGWNVVNDIAAWRAIEEYKEMENTSREDSNKRKVAARIYYERYFDERIKLMPGSAKTRERDIELEMKNYN